MEELKPTDEAREAFERRYQADSRDPAQAERFAEFVAGFDAARSLSSGVAASPPQPQPQDAWKELNAAHDIADDAWSGLLLVGPNGETAYKTPDECKQAGTLVPEGWRRFDCYEPGAVERSQIAAERVFGSRATSPTEGGVRVPLRMLKESEAAPVFHRNIGHAWAYTKPQRDYAEALIRKFCEVNGLPLAQGGSNHG